MIGEVGAGGLTAASGVSWFEQCRSKMESVAFATSVILQRTYGPQQANFAAHVRPSTSPNTTLSLDLLAYESTSEIKI